MMAPRATRRDGTGRAPGRACFRVAGVAQITLAAWAPASIRRGRAATRSGITATGPIRE